METQILYSTLSYSVALLTIQIPVYDEQGKKSRTRNNQDVQPVTGQDVPSTFIRGVDIRVLLYKIIVLHTL